MLAQDRFDTIDRLVQNLISLLLLATCVWWTIEVYYTLRDWFVVVVQTVSLAILIPTTRLITHYMALCIKQELYFDKNGVNVERHHNEERKPSEQKGT